jgi:hypothetical protein
MSVSNPQPLNIKPIPPNPKTITYTLTVDTSKAGYLLFYFVAPDGTRWPLSIYDNLLVTVQLDSSINWKFLSGNGIAPMTIETPAPGDANPEAGRYWTADPAPVPYAANDLPQQIQFYAQLNTAPGVPKYNLDPFNFNLALQQDDGTWIQIVLDPDMPNPGDPPPGQN